MRRGDSAKRDLRSVLAGTLANLLNAAIAGMLIGWKEETLWDAGR